MISGASDNSASSFRGRSQEAREAWVQLLWLAGIFYLVLVITELSLNRFFWIHKETRRTASSAGYQLGRTRRQVN